MNMESKSPNISVLCSSSERVLFAGEVQRELWRERGDRDEGGEVRTPQDRQVHQEELRISRVLQ